MGPEHKVFLHLDTVSGVLWVSVLNVLEYLHLHTGLVLKFLLVPDNLKADIFVSLVVKSLESLAEAALAQEFKHLIAVCDVIPENSLVVTFIVIISIIWL